MWYKTFLVMLCGSLSALWCEESQFSKELVDGQNQFAFHLFHKLPKNEGNICYSPYSVAEALTVAYAGAAGETKDEIGMLFSYPVSSDLLRLSRDMKAIDTLLQQNMAIANAVAVDKAFLPSKGYLQALDAFDAKLFTIDTTGDLQGSVSKINDWVKKKTQDRIADLLQPNDLSALSKLVLLNAVYLKSEWLSTFSKEATRDDNFYTESNDKITVPMMRQKEGMLLFQDDDLSVVWKGMKAQGENGPEIETIILVPESEKGRALLRANLSMELIEQLKQQAKSVQVELFLPKCSIKKRIDLNTTLMALGMRQAFTKSADFSPISSADNLLIQKVLHEAYMKFNESGIEATGTTAVIIGLTSVGPNHTPPKIVRCDKPFYAVILEKKTNLVLFVAYVARPEKAMDR